MGKSIIRISMVSLLFLLLAAVPFTAYAEDGSNAGNQQGDGPQEMILGQDNNQNSTGGVDDAISEGGVNGVGETGGNTDVSSAGNSENGAENNPAIEEDANTQNSTTETGAQGTVGTLQATGNADVTGNTAGASAGTTSQTTKTSSGTTQAKATSTSKYATPLPAGTYMIVTAKSNTRVLDVEGGSKANGANVLLWDWHNAAWQKWKITYDANGYYTIKNVHSGKVLDVAGASTKKGANVLCWQGKASNNLNQRWVLEKSGTGYILKSALNPKLVLDCTGNSSANGTNIGIWSANGQANQRFNFVNLNPNVAFGKTLENGIYTMGVSNKPTQMVEVQGKSIKNDGNVDLYASNKGMNQRWSFQYNGAGLYRVVNVGSGLSLDVAGKTPTAGTNVLQYSANSGKNQLWGVAENADGTYSLYSALNGLALDVHAASTANLANLETYYPTNGKNQKFVIKKASDNYAGTYQIITHLSQNAKLLDVPDDSISNGTQLALWADNDGLNQRFLFEKVGSAYSIRPVSSGKFLTDDGGKVVQKSAQGTGGVASSSQLWTVTFAKNGFQIKNVGTGKVMSVAGSKAVNSAKIQETAWNGAAAQKFLLSKTEMLPRGLYTLSSIANSKLAVDAEGASFKNAANAIVYKSSGMNNQKVALVHVGSGYYRMTLALGGTVLGMSSATASSVKFYNWTGADTQLWKPVLMDGGFTLQNKASGKQLAAAGKASGNDVVQQEPASSALQKWHLAKGPINYRDMGSFVSCLGLAPGSVTLTATRAPIGFSTTSKQWKALQNALGECWSAGFDIGFISLDCDTGMTLSSNANRTIYGASTIKALYITYLCEELLESGSISLGSVEGLMYDTAVYSNNDTYRTLRYNYGSQAGFNAWLSKVGVGELDLYDYYTPKTLAKAWVHMLEYESSNGKYVGFWRSIFDHGNMSSINDALGCTVYSKPGWFDGGSIGYILDDAGIVKNSAGTYVLAVMSTAYPYNWQKGKIENLVRAIDAVHSTIPSTR